MSTPGVPQTVQNVEQRSRCRGSSGRPRGRPPSASRTAPAAAGSSAAAPARPRPPPAGPAAASPASSRAGAPAGTRSCRGDPGAPGPSGRGPAAGPRPPLVRCEGRSGRAATPWSSPPRETAGSPCPCRMGCQPSVGRRRSRAAEWVRSAFPEGSMVPARRPLSLHKWPGSSAQRRCSRAAEGNRSAFQGGSQVSGRRRPILGPTRPSAERTPTWPRCCSAAWWGSSQLPLRRAASPLVWPKDSWKRCPARLGHSGRPGASSRPGPVATAWMSGAPAHP